MNSFHGRHLHLECGEGGCCQDLFACPQIVDFFSHNYRRAGNLHLYLHLSQPTERQSSIARDAVCATCLVEGSNPCSWLLVFWLINFLLTKQSLVSVSFYQLAFLNKQVVDITSFGHKLFKNSRPLLSFVFSMWRCKLLRPKRKKQRHLVSPVGMSRSSHKNNSWTEINTDTWLSSPSVVCG